MFEELKNKVYLANMKLYQYGLVPLTWGNVSARLDNYIVIKPSGVEYSTMSPQDMVVVDLNGNIIDGKLRPSSDTKTHLEIYRSCSKITSVCHTHSKYATSFAQAGISIKAMGTTHADYFFGDIPCTRTLTNEEVTTDYELNTGKVIAETFKDRDWLEVPAVLVMQHGPFTWGSNIDKGGMDAVENAIVLEEVAQINFQTMLINPNTSILPDYVLNKHYYRKHGANAYYGQK